MNSLFIAINQTSIIFIWEVFDLTPWNYSISVNDAIKISNTWNGSDITFEYSITKPETIMLKLIIFDLFSNQAEDTVIVEIKPVNGTIIPSHNRNSLYALVVIIAFVPIGFLLRKRWRK